MASGGSKAPIFQLSEADKQAYAERLKQSVQQGKALSPELIQILRSGQIDKTIKAHGGSTGQGGGWGVFERGEVRTLDLLEAEVRGYNELGFEQAFGTENANQLLSRVLHGKIHSHMPYFTKRINEALRMIQIADGPSFSPSVNKSEDRGELIIKVSPKSLVQIANRHSVTYPGHKPLGFVDINGDHYNRMSVVEQAALLLHEAVYVLYSQVGHMDSVKTRKFVGFLLSKQHEREPMLPTMKDSTAAVNRAMYASRLNREGLGEFFAVFLDPNVANQKGTSATRQAIYMKMMGHNRAPIEDKEELSFMFLFSIHSGKGGLPHINELFMGGPQETAALKKACDFFRRHVGSGDLLASGPEEALRDGVAYCRRIGR